MRAGGCSFQQAGLTQEAASVVKQALTLARCRGHAQVTPLHVAKTLLSSSTGLFKTACLQSHSHPLQCKALDLCFNVALNRLPTSPNSCSTNPHFQNSPSISNALIAAFKRAQAHQRRGSIDNQQQQQHAILAVKIELEQLIISILDDPSVSRVMREAGFSSTQVKSNVERTVNSLELSTSQVTTTTTQVIGSKVINTKPIVSDPIGIDEDISSLIQSLVNGKKKSVVIVGDECISSIEEHVVRGLMNKVEHKELDVPEVLREVKFITLALCNFGQFSKTEVDKEIGEIKSAVRSCLGKGVVLYLGDLNWAARYRDSSSEVEYNYSPVDHIVMELGKMVFELNGGSSLSLESSGRFWLLGIASFQTYMSCKSGYPSLEAIWDVQSLTIPSRTLRLSLVTADSELNTESINKTNNKNDNECMIFESGDKHIGSSFVDQSSAKFEFEARSSLHSSTTFKSDSTTNQLPAWLQQCKNDPRMREANNIHQYQSFVPVSDLCKKWNSIGNSSTTDQEKTLTLITSISSSSASAFSYQHQNHHILPVVEPTQSWREQHFWASEVPHGNKSINEPSLRLYIPEHNEIPKQPFSSNPNPNPNSVPTSFSSSDLMETTDQYYSNRFKQLNTENLKTLCEALEKKVPRQKDIIPEIVNTILKCRAGDMKRKGKMDNCYNQVKEETWLLFQGVGIEDKENIARELARLVFGNSENNFISITLSRFSTSCSRADFTEDFRNNKRSRDEQSCSYFERFTEQVFQNPHRVFFLEDTEQVDYSSQLGFKIAIERGKITTCNGEEADLGDAIVILSCESLSSRSRACTSPSEKQKLAKDDDPKEEINITLDLNISFEDDQNEDHEQSQSIDDIVGLIQSVDRTVIFKI